MPSLKDFVNNALSRGVEKDELIKELQKKGYSKSEISQALPEDDEKKLYKENNSFSEILGQLFVNPKEFFVSVRRPTIWASLITLISSSIVMFILSYFLSMMFGFGLGFSFGYSLLGYASIFSFISLFFGIIITFVVSGLSHGMAKILGGNGSFVDSFNSTAYSFSAAQILSIVPLVGLLSYIWGLVLASFGFYEYHKFSVGKAIASVLVPVVAIIIILVLLVIAALSAMF